MKALNFLSEISLEELFKKSFRAVIETVWQKFWNRISGVYSAVSCFFIITHRWQALSYHSVHCAENQSYCHYCILLPLFMVRRLVMLYSMWNYSHRIFYPAAIRVGQKKNWLEQHISSFWKYDVHLAPLCLCAPPVLVVISAPSRKE